MNMTASYLFLALAVFKYQDGKMISLETGATKIPK